MNPTRPHFAPFTAPHFIAVAIIVTVIVSLVTWSRRQSAAVAQQTGRVLGGILLVYYLLESIARVTWLGMRFADTLPFELCSALFFIGAYAYFTSNELAFDIVYFWTFAGTLHALITPTPRAGFPDPNFFQYFLAHGLLILSAVYSAAALRRVPRAGSLLRAFLALQVFTALDAAIDALGGENYLYLHHKPPSPTLLDVFGDWPRYIIGGEVVALVSFTLWNLPFALQRWRAPRALAARPGKP